jgi:hypothetical protein|tara:strand:- start:4773 stop:5123 length:351 start_codon:yes stop_codon:yes gene_type:complete
MINQLWSRTERLYSSIQAFLHGGLRKPRSEPLAKPNFDARPKIIPFPWENDGRTPKGANMKIAREISENEVYLFRNENKAIVLCRAIRQVHGLDRASIRQTGNGLYRVGIKGASNE